MKGMVNLMIAILVAVGAWDEHQEKKEKGLLKEVKPVEGGGSTGIPQLANETAISHQERREEGSLDEFPDQENEPMSNNIDTIQFTMSLYDLVRTALNDPKCKEEIYQAVRDGAGEPTTVLGAANLATGDEKPEWFTLFLGTNRRVKPGSQGYVFRNKKGDRVSARLKRQVKNQQAQTPGQVLPQQLQGSSDLLQRAMAGDAEAAKTILQLANGGSSESGSESYEASGDDPVL